jgi:hypothetical protein
VDDVVGETAWAPAGMVVSEALAEPDNLQTTHQSQQKIVVVIETGKNLYTSIPTLLNDYYCMSPSVVRHKRDLGRNSACLLSLMSISRGKW